MKNYIFIILLILCAGCTTTKYIPVESIKTEYRNSSDSIYLHDSIYYEVKTSNDTVYINKYKYKLLEKFNTDTIYKVDSIPYIKEVERIKEVHSLYWWEKALIYFGIILILIIIICLIYKFAK